MRLPPAVASLPVAERLDDILSALDGGRAVLVAEPGAGKTTLMPLGLLGADWLGDRRVLVLEPRRVAARAAAARVAALLGEPVGRTVGLRTRDETRVSAGTRIEFITEGLLTRMVQTDPELSGVGAVVFDEFHERSLAADLGLALVLDVAASLRADLRVLVMSATIDADRVARHLSVDAPVPVVECPGRSHPIDVQWRPVEDPRSRHAVERAAASAAGAAVRHGARGVLVFLAGIADIRRADEHLPDAVADIAWLHGSMSAAEQDAALEPIVDRPRIILSTDLAQTSLTIEGIDTVVDTGLHRASVHDPGTGMARLVTRPISQAAADQRAGRAGRLGPGTAIRLWSQTEHGHRNAFDPPEIHTADLAGLVIETLAWGVADPAQLAFLDLPPAAAVDDARRLLTELGALAPTGSLTELGRALAGRGLHPRLASVMHAGRSTGQVELAAAAVAALEDRDLFRGDPRTRGSDLTERVAALLGHAGPERRADRGALKRSRRRQRQIRDAWEGSAGELTDLGDLGSLVVAGYPDRVGRRREREARGAGPSRYGLSGGGGVVVDEHDPLGSAEFIVAAQTDGDRADARLWLGVSIDRSDIERALPHAVSSAKAVEWDRSTERFVHMSGDRLGEIWLNAHRSPADPGPELADALCRLVRREGLHLLDWNGAAMSLRHRLRFAGEHLDGWAVADDAHLLEALEQWLAPVLWTARGRQDLRRVDVAAAMRLWIGRDRSTELDRLLPSRWTFPSGRTRDIDYSGDRPSLSSRVQDFYGLTSGPAVADGRIEVALELLSPAGRPVQVTSDLAGFWAGSWVEVRKDMIGRYPKHDWPLDPTSGDRR